MTEGVSREDRELRVALRGAREPTYDLPLRCRWHEKHWHSGYRSRFRGHTRRHHKRVSNGIKPKRPESERRDLGRSHRKKQDRTSGYFPSTAAEYAPAA